mgnify:FL=1
MEKLCWQAQERPLSKLDTKVHWRLNDLLRASKKAKEFAAVSWSDPMDQDGSHFIQWQLESNQQIETNNSVNLDEVSMSDIEEGEIVFSDDDINASAELQAIISKAKEEAFQAGVENGKHQAEQSYSEATVALKNLIEKIRLNEGNIKEFHDPLKKLAIHLAEQLIRGELIMSSAAIQRLVNQSLEDIERQGTDAIVITLHPEDLESLLDTPDLMKEGIEFRSDIHLSRGSVRVTMGDSAIEDLIEHRLQNIVESLYKENVEDIPSLETEENSNPQEIADEQVVQQGTDERSLSVSNEEAENSLDE